MNIERIDLNLLVVFEAVMEARSLTTAGARLGQSQPTISHAMARLRGICGDPLFVRAGRTIEPTPYAEQLFEPVKHALEVLRGSLSRTPRFDAAAARRTFTLLMSDVGQMTMLPALVRRVIREAPGVVVAARQIPREDYVDALRAGKADLAIGALRQLRAGFFAQRLFEDSYVCVVCANHPAAAAGRMTLERYLEARHVGIISPGLGDAEIDRALVPEGRSRQIAVKVPHFLAAPMIVPDTDLVVTLPSRVMKAFGGHGPPVRSVPLLVEASAIRVQQYWHERYHHDEGVRWLRAIIAELFMDRHRGARPAVEQELTEPV